jgi:signal peptidase II
MPQLAVIPAGRYGGRSTILSSPQSTEHRRRRLTGKTIGTGLLVILVLAGLDQLLKRIIVDWLGPDATHHRWELAGRYLAFQYVENDGAAFGLLAGRTMLLIVLAVVVAGGFVATMRRDLAHDRRMQIAIVLILAGATGNLIDRIRLGYVVDFVAIGAWPKFNLADTCISVALILLAWSSFQATSHETSHLPSSPSSKEAKLDSSNCE